MKDVIKPETYLEIETDPAELDKMLNLKHVFSPGLYLREVTVPEGKLIIGHHHRHRHLNVFLKGKMILFKPDGIGTVVKAPMVFTGDPGRKVVYAIEESMWMNIYATDETDIKRLELTYVDVEAPWPEGKAILKKILSGDAVNQIIQGDKLCLGEALQ